MARHHLPDTPGRHSGDLVGTRWGRGGDAGAFHRWSVPDSRVVLAPERLTQRTLEDLAGTRLRQGFSTDTDLLGNLEPGDPTPTELDELRSADLFAGNHHRVDTLPPAVVGDPEDRRLGDPGMGVQDVLNLHRVDVLPTGDHHVLQPVDQIQTGLVVQVAQVTGVVPTTTQRSRGLLGLVPVPRSHVRTPDHNLTDLPRRDNNPVEVQHPHRHPQYRVP